MSNLNPDLDPTLQPVRTVVRSSGAAWWAAGAVGVAAILAVAYVATNRPDEAAAQQTAIAQQQQAISTAQSAQAAQDATAAAQSASQSAAQIALQNQQNAVDQAAQQRAMAQAQIDRAAKPQPADQSGRDTSATSPNTAGGDGPSKQP